MFLTQTVIIIPLFLRADQSQQLRSLYYIEFISSRHVKILYPYVHGDAWITAEFIACLFCQF